MIAKKTLVLGASSNPEQYSHMAVKKLLAAGHPVEAIGKEPFLLAGVAVKATQESFSEIHTVTLYMNASRQSAYEAYILSLHPKRIIFNPGAENSSFFDASKELGIEVLNACTLVMLSTGAY
jgi:predicted CoA-binding protein